jgi:arylsulfatase A-like enzyme
VRPHRIAGLGALAVTCCRAGCRWFDDRPRVLLIVHDTVRADPLSLYGYPHRTTPTLDALGAEAMVYTHAIAAGTWTPPSHASLFTGLMPSEHRVGHVREEIGSGIRALDPGVPLLAEAMAASGYRTAAYVANYGFLDPVFGLARGFEDYKRENLRPADRLAARVSGWIERNRPGPFFLFLNVMDAHGPHKAPPGYDRMFGPADGLPHPKAPDGPDPVEAARRIMQYDGEIRWIDDQLARIFDALRRVGRWDETMIVVTSDHGELFGEDGRWGHGGDPIFPLVHVPLIVKYPQGQPRGRDDRPVSLAAVPATALTVAGEPALPDTEPALGAARGVAVSEYVVDDRSTRIVLLSEDLMLVERRAGGRSERHAFRLGRDGVPVPMNDAEETTALDAALADWSKTLAPPRLGPVVHPEADRVLADKLRQLGYIE